MMESKVKILIADETHDFSKLCREKLGQLGYRDILIAENGEEALSMIRFHRPDVVLMDIWLYKTDSLQILKTIREESMLPEQRQSFIMLSVVNNQNIFYEATELGADYCMLKPPSFHMLS